MKSSLIALLAVATVGIFSCSKTKLTNDAPTVYPPIEQSRTVASTWIPMTFSEMTNENGTTYLKADASLPGVSDADQNSHVAFAYAKIQDASGQISYQRIPLYITNASENITIDYAVLNGVFSVNAYDNGGQTIATDRFQNFEFRLFMVSTADFQNMQVDWDDYSSVENAFSIIQSARSKH
jgi:hypothetical protein